MEQIPHLLFTFIYGLLLKIHSVGLKQKSRTFLKKANTNFWLLHST